MRHPKGSNGSGRVPAARCSHRAAVSLEQPKSPERQVKRHHDHGRRRGDAAGASWSPIPIHDIVPGACLEIGSLGEPAPLDKAKIKEAFRLMGQYLLDRKALGEIAVYGGRAILLQFEWRRTS